MAIRVPPGRTGRLWLMRKLAIAARGVEVLDEKRQALVREQRRLSQELDSAAATWEQRARLAAEWNDRALALVGARRLRLASLPREGSAEVAVDWRNVLGAACPGDATIRVGPAPDYVALGGGAAVARAASAHEQALAAAAALAAARAAYGAVTRELVATTRRQRAIERRWIPEHEDALRRLELLLDQRELEDAARARKAASSGRPAARR